MCSVMLSLILCFRFFAMPKKVRWKAEEELIRMLLAIHARHQPQQIFKPQMQPTITTYAPATIQSPFQPTTGTIGTGVPMIIGETQNPMAQQPQVKFTGILPLPQQPSPTMKLPLMSPMGTTPHPAIPGGTIFYQA